MIFVTQRNTGIPGKFCNGEQQAFRRATLRLIASFSVFYGDWINCKSEGTVGNIDPKYAEMRCYRSISSCGGLGLEVQ